MDLSKFDPITEENKENWIGWLTSFLSDSEAPDYAEFDKSPNRVFKTESGDVQQARDLAGSMLLTLQKYTLLPK